MVTCLLTKDGRTAGSTRVDLLHPQLVDDVLIVVHIFEIHNRISSNNQIATPPDLSLRFKLLIGSLEERARQCYDLFFADGEFRMICRMRRRRK
jgi:hypothetical protein